MNCETCSGWPSPDRGIIASGGHNRLCPFAPVPFGYAAMFHGMDFSHPSGSATFHGTYPLPAGDRVAGYKSPDPPNSGSGGVP